MTLRPLQGLYLFQQMALRVLVPSAIHGMVAVHIKEQIQAEAR